MVSTHTYTTFYINVFSDLPYSCPSTTAPRRSQKASSNTSFSITHWWKTLTSIHSWVASLPHHFYEVMAKWWHHINKPIAFPRINIPCIPLHFHEHMCILLSLHCIVLWLNESVLRIYDFQEFSSHKVTVYYLLFTKHLGILQVSI